MQESHAFLPRDRFQSLLDALVGRGYRCIGPVVRDGAIVFDAVTSVEQLARGVVDDQAPGRYRLRETGNGRWFEWVNGPQALKPLLFRPREALWRAERGDAGEIRFGQSLPEPQPIAVIGVRACDLAAMRIQDTVFLESGYRDPYYARWREGLLVIAVNCARSAPTCFCVSTGDGPRAGHSFDLALSELDAGFVVEAGGEAGQSIIDSLGLEAAADDQCAQAQRQTEAAAGRQTRRLPPVELQRSLYARLDHSRWDAVAERCLGCGNCTMVCPTCFCHAEQDVPDLDGAASVHERQWDSCFSNGHSYIHGVTIRPDIRSRYRQWLTHKLAGWHDQFGRSGCVGCGRCITWCPVAIDLTEEVNEIVRSET